MLNRKDLDTIHAIADRAVQLYERLDMLSPGQDRFVRVGIIHELLTTHEEIIPLRLDNFLAADDSNFAHDIGGIHRHIDYGTRTQKARLNDCFLPRFANVVEVRS